MRPLVVGPSPVITPSRTIVSACAAVLRQEIFDGSSAPIGSAMWATGADIGRFLFSFSCSRSQHVHAGVNEWLTIRKSHRVVLKGCGFVVVTSVTVQGNCRGRNLLRRRWGAQAAIPGQSGFGGRC